MSRPSDKLIIEGNVVRAVSPEGQSATMPLDEYYEHLVPKHDMHTGDVVLPNGVHSAIAKDPYLIWVHETPPSVYTFKWIAEDSEIPFGPEATYRDVKIALPYVIVFCVFVRGPGGRFTLSNVNECFFRTEPYKHVTDPLLYPGLLNCSKFPESGKHPLAWICTQYLRPVRPSRNADSSTSMRNDLTRLLQCLFHMGFNYSSEHHEGSSWYTASKDVDPRIATVQAWEEATQENPLFVLDVPWIPVGKSVMEVAQRIFSQHVPKSRRHTARSMARLVYNHGKTEERSNGKRAGREKT